MYLETVGRNATLILNIPPNKAGVLPDASVRALTGMGDLIRARLTNDFAKSATVTVSETRQAGANRNYVADNMIDGNKDTYWATNDGTTEATITLMWDTAKTIRYVELMEYIAKGQRVKKFTVETTQDGVNWTRRATGVQTTTIGYKRIVPLNSNTANSYGAGYDVMGVRITIEDSRACPLISKVSVY
jgi:alpha-L-fucosidase